MQAGFAGSGETMASGADVADADLAMLINVLFGVTGAFALLACVIMSM